MKKGRRCVILFEPQREAIFHQWTNDGCAIVEYDDGTCDQVKPWYVRFIIPDLEIKDTG